MVYLTFTYWDFIIIGLAMYYFVTIVVDGDEGPFGLLDWFRLKVGCTKRYIYQGDDGLTLYFDVKQSGYEDEYMGFEWRHEDQFWAKVISCHRCFSPYVGTIILLLYAYLPFTRIIFTLFALAGGVVKLRE